MKLTCAVTGHRPGRFSFGYREEAPACVRLKAALAEQITHLAQSNVGHFLSGMAQGTDLWAAEAVLCLREIMPELRLSCALPCPEQAARWDVRSQQRHAAVLARSDETIVVSPAYSPGCMQLRDRWLVEHADLLLAVYDGALRGGTAYTIRYAVGQGRPVMILDPETLLLTQV